jgi:hypothetical protein
MTERIGKVRRFNASTVDGWTRMGDHNIHIGPAIEKREGGPLSAYFALWERRSRGRAGSI